MILILGLFPYLQIWELGTDAFQKSQAGGGVIGALLQDTPGSNP